MSATTRAGGWLCVWTQVSVTMAVLVVSALCPMEVQAQASAATPAQAWDVAVLAGAFVGRPDVTTDRGYDEWFETAQVALVAGRHFTTHLKGEFEVSTSADGRQYIQEPLAIPNTAFPIFISSDRLTRVSAVRASLTYQFFDNQWAHPFVTVGVAASSDRVRVRRVPQHLRLGSAEVVVAGGEEGPATANRVGLTVGTGVKLYVTPQLFVRADTQFTVLSAATHVALRAGLGIDF